MLQDGLKKLKTWNHFKKKGKKKNIMHTFLCCFNRKSQNESFTTEHG